MRFRRSAPEDLTEEQLAERAAKRKRGLRRRLIVYGSIVAILWGIYVWQPIEIDFIPRGLPPQTWIDPDSAKLFAPGTRIMVITAHPDDAEFYIAGTLLRLSRGGAEMFHLLHTDGDKAYYFWADNSTLRATRQKEQREASGRWKAKEIRFLGFPDGRLRKNDETVGKTVEAIREWNPDYILCFDGDYPPRSSHQDHRRSGDITVEACKEAKFTGWLMRYSTQAPNFVVDVSKVWEARLDMLAIHASQFSGQKLKFIQDGRTESSMQEGELRNYNYGEAFRCSKFDQGQIAR